MDLEIIDLRNGETHLESNATDVIPTPSSVVIYLTRGYSIRIDKSIIDWINEKLKAAPDQLSRSNPIVNTFQTTSAQGAEAQ